MRALVALALCSFVLPAFAQPQDPFTGSVALGYLATSGNTDSTNANASLRVEWSPAGRWRHRWDALAVSSRTSDVTTAETYSAGYTGRRDFSDANYLFASLDWRQDRFSGYEQQVTEAVGFGRRLIDSERQTLALEAGGGAKQSTLLDGTDVDEGIVRGALDYVLRFNENAEFNQKLVTEIGEDNRFTESVSALRTRILGNLAVVLSYTLRRNSDVPPGVVNTDTFTSVSIEYGF
ncbi:MAG TPA: DUF481 domain-containing protein [Gammaproteobacteria bacterium]